MCTFIYNFGVDGALVVKADPALECFTTADGYGPYQGYAVECVFGELDGYCVSLDGGPGTGFNCETDVAFDNVIFDADDQGYGGSFYGVDSHGIQLTINGCDFLLLTSCESFFLVNEATGCYSVLDFQCSDAPCFQRGARILTERGPVAVENLVVGDLAITASGEKKPIVWLGNRSLDCRRQTDPKKFWPFCVSAGAFGEEMPSHDLWLSPDHAVAVDGALIPVCKLENGLSVVQHEQAFVQYWHVELAEHEVILAEGLPVESYMDYGNRSFFANGGAFIQLHPEIAPKHWPDPSWPVILHGPKIVEAKAKLIERLAARGVLTSEADVHLIADGRRIEPMALGPERYGFALPVGCESIVLKSRSFVPAHVNAKATDMRTLGICIKRLQIDGDEVPLDAPVLKDAGWHAPQTSHRWTTGETPMPTKAQFILIDLAGLGLYRRAPTTAVVTSFPQRRRA